MVYLIAGISRSGRNNRIRTRIVMVYRKIIIVLVKIQLCIRTRIVMVYLVFISDFVAHYKQYSYKNCYGLSEDTGAFEDVLFQYSYKNCYGLSRGVYVR